MPGARVLECRAYGLWQFSWYLFQFYKSNIHSLSNYKMFFNKGNCAVFVLVPSSSFETLSAPERGGFEPALTAAAWLEMLMNPLAEESGS